MSGLIPKLFRLYGYNGTSWRNARLDRVTRSLQFVDCFHHEIHEGSHFFLEGYAELGAAGTFYVKLVTPDDSKWGHFIWEIGSIGILTTTLDEDATGGMAGGSRATIHANNRNTNCWTGSHTGGNGEATVLTDSTQSWDVGGLIGMQVFNSTDGSSGIITDNDGTTVTVAALAGGTDNDWDTNDVYEINQSQFVITSNVAIATSYTQRVSNVKFGSRSSGGNVSRVDELILKQDTTYLRSFTSGSASNIINFKASWYEHTDKDA